MMIIDYSPAHLERLPGADAIWVVLLEVIVNINRSQDTSNRCLDTMSEKRSLTEKSCDEITVLPDTSK